MAPIMGFTFGDSRRMGEPNDGLNQYTRPILLNQVWDWKDNEHFIKKTRILGHYTFLTSGVMAIIDVCCVPRPNPGLWTTLYRIQYWMVPVMGAGLAYTATVNAVSNLRGKTADPMNHAYGGLAIGAVAGKALKSTTAGILTGLFFGVLGYMAKDAMMHGMKPFPKYDYHSRYGGPFAYKANHSLYEQRPAYWVRSEAEIPEAIKRGQY